MNVKAIFDYCKEPGKVPVNYRDGKAIISGPKNDIVVARRKLGIQISYFNGGGYIITIIIDVDEAHEMAKQIMLLT